jgi:hypothetical protein
MVPPRSFIRRSLSDFCKKGAAERIIRIDEMPTELLMQSCCIGNVFMARPLEIKVAYFKR